jgi:hypothetical protein
VRERPLLGQSAALRCTTNRLAELVHVVGDEVVDVLDLVRAHLVGLLARVSTRASERG